MFQRGASRLGIQPNQPRPEVNDEEMHRIDCRPGAHRRVGPAKDANLKRFLEETLDMKAEIELARRISPHEAKITVVVVHKGHGERMTFSIFLRHFAGRWTTVRGDAFRTHPLVEEHKIYDSYLQPFLRT